MWMDGVCLRSMLPFSLFLHTVSETESESSYLVAKSWLTIFNLSVGLCLHFFYYWDIGELMIIEQIYFRKLTYSKTFDGISKDTEYYYSIVKEDRKNIHIYIYMNIYTHIWIYICTHIYNIYGHFWNMNIFITRKNHYGVIYKP